MWRGSTYWCRPKVDKMREDKLRLFEHVMIREETEAAIAVIRMNIEGR